MIFIKMSSIPNINNLDNLGNLTLDKLSQDIIEQLLPYIYVIIGVVSVMCILLIYISIMVTVIPKRINNLRRT
jgi:hypothetical protein